MADSYSSFDVARLAFDGADAGTTFTDQLGHTFTAAGAGATTSTAQMKYGTASGLFTSASTAYINSATTTDWNMGSGDFCVDVWIYPTALTNANALIMSIANGSGTPNISLSLLSNGSLEAKIIVGGTTKTLTSETGAVVVNRWHHVALTRNGGTARLFNCGSIRATDTTLSTTAVDFSSDSLNVGGSAGAGASGGFIGNIDMFRLTKGHARYTGAYIPPLPDFNTIGTATTISSLGSYTRQVSLAGEYYYDAAISGVNEAIVALGWTLFDIRYKQGGGEVTTVYRALNKDGVSYKYAMIVWSKTINSACFTSCESWSIATQTATNECWNQNREANRFTFFLNGTDIIVFGHPRYLGVMTYIQNSAGYSNFVFEVEREAPEDTAAAGYPCWGIWSSEWQFNYFAAWENNLLLAMPRIRHGGTGNLAAQWTTFVTSIGAFGSDMGVGHASKPVETLRSNNHRGQLKSAWDESKRLILTAKPVYHSTTSNSTNTYSNYGRIFGLKYVPHQTGTQFNKVSVKTDSDLFPTSGGSDTDHWILSPALALTTQLTTHGSYTPTTVNHGTAGSAFTSLVFTGTAVYGATGSGIRKYVLATSTHSIVANSGVQIFDIAFDGRYVYGTTATGITRIDTANADATTTLTLGTGGGAFIAWDGAGRLIMSQRTTSTTPSLYAIDTGSFAQIGSTMTLGTGRTTATNVQGLCGDGNGKVLGVYCNTTTAADAYQVVIDTNAITAQWGSASDNRAMHVATVVYRGMKWAINWYSAPSGAWGGYVYNGDGSWTGATSTWTSSVSFNANTTAATSTSIYPSRISFNRGVGYALMGAPATSTANKSFISNGTNGGYVNSGSSGVAEQSIGGFTSTLSIKASLIVDNLILFMDNNLLTYMVTNFQVPTCMWSNIYYGQVLIPK